MVKTIQRAQNVSAKAKPWRTPKLIVTLVEDSDIVTASDEKKDVVVDDGVWFINGLLEG